MSDVNSPAYSAKYVGGLLEQLSASKQREAELEKKLEAAEMMNSLQAQSIGMLSQDLEAAEARCAEVADVALRNGEALLAAEASIKASQEQEPFGFLELAGRGAPDFHFKCFRHGQMKPVYEKPFIQPELAELQREIETLQSALTAKVTVCGDEQIGALKRENAELRKLLESKVPEGWQLVPKVVTPEIEAVYINESCVFVSAQDLHTAMLAAAPQPKEQKQ